MLVPAPAKVLIAPDCKFETVKQFLQDCSSPVEGALRIVVDMPVSVLNAPDCKFEMA